MNFTHTTPHLPHIIWHRLGLSDYVSIWKAMQHFTTTRSLNTSDELWTLEHTPIYTLGQTGNLEHILNSASIPVLRSDRGGQATYHGPGQLVAYILYDLRRSGIGIKTLVWRLEQAIINLLVDNQIDAERWVGFPGVYVAKRKIASVGLRVRKGCCFHGISLNCNMDLMPFRNIVTCGNAQLEMIQLMDLMEKVNMIQIEHDLVKHLALQLQCTLYTAKF